MNRRQAENYNLMMDRLASYGIERDDREALRRIEMTLAKWSERECGDEYGNCIERDEVTGKPFLTYDAGSGPRKRYTIPDKERGALKRLVAIMARYPSLRAYHQGDPRGCALYILKASDIPQGGDISTTYNRGIAVCI